MILFYSPTMKDLAEKIAAENKISRDNLPSLSISHIDLGKIDWDLFPNKDPKLFIEDEETDVEDNDVAFLAYFKPETNFAEMTAIHELTKAGPRSLKIIMPYFPGTMDRVERKGDVVTSAALAWMFSSLPFHRIPFYTYDIHSLQERDYFRHPIILRLESALKFLCLSETPDTAICFPDKGAWDKFGKYFPAEYFPDRILCYKERLGDKRKVKIVEGHPKGKHIVIVDDLVMTGETILECARVVCLKGALSVSVRATHAVFPNKSYFKMNEFPFKSFRVSNSCPETVSGFKDCKTKFDVVPLTPLIAKILMS